MVAAGPAAHEEVALKLNTTLPVTSQEEKCNGMLKNYIFDHQALTKLIYYIYNIKDYTHIYIFSQKKQLSTIGGSDLWDGVQRLITATINPIFLYEYNWTGKKCI